MFTFLQTTAGTQPAGGGMSMWIMLALIFVVMWFFMIRPQRKQQKELQNFRDSLKKGDKVVTIGGIYGTVKEVNNNVVVLEIAPSVKIKVDKSSVYADMSTNPQQK